MFKLHIETGNAAFSTEESGEHGEVARILRRLADALEAQGGTDGPLRDAYGNRVGAWKLESEA